MIKSVLLLCIIVFIFSTINNITSAIDNATLNQSFLYSNIERINDIIIDNTYNENGNEEWWRSITKLPLINLYPKVYSTLTTIPLVSVKK